MEVKDVNYCVILAGGIGSRLWPVSRKELPKQFLDWFGTGRTLLQQTYDRFRKIIDAKHIFIVTNEHYADLVREQLPEVAQDRILKEPYPAEHAAQRSVGYDMYQPPLSAR